MSKAEQNPDKERGNESLQGEIIPAEAAATSIELHSKAKMKRLSQKEIDELGLGKSKEPLITSAVETSPDGNKNLIYVMRTGDGSVFKLDKEHPIVQELQFKAAAAAIDSFEVQTPIQTAQAIISSIRNAGYDYQGGLMEAWDFAIEALDKMIDFQSKQLRLDQINLLQTSTRQLTEDLRLGLKDWMFLPAPRKEASVILMRLGVAAAVQEYTGEETVNAAKRLKLIDELFNTMAEEKAKSVTHIKADRAYTYASKAKEYIGDILSQGNKNTEELSKTLLGFIYGESLKDEGVINATLERSGEAGKKLLKLIEDSGMTINQFFKNLTSGMFKSSEDDDDNDI